MPISLAEGTFNTGRDGRLVIIGGLFGRVSIPNITMFKCEQQTAMVKVDRLDGTQLQAELPKGWTGSFSADRGDATLDRFFAGKEVAWYANGTYKADTIYFYIAEADGTTTTYQFDSTAMKLTDSGTFKGDATVSQSVSFTANRRKLV